MKNAQPTIKAAKRYAQIRYGRLPRIGWEMEIMRYEEMLPVEWSPTFKMPYTYIVYLANYGGRYQVVTR